MLHFPEIAGEVLKEPDPLSLLAGAVDVERWQREPRAHHEMAIEALYTDAALYFRLCARYDYVPALIKNLADDVLRIFHSDKPASHPEGQQRMRLARLVHSLPVKPTPQELASDTLMQQYLLHSPVVEFARAIDFAVPFHLVLNKELAEISASRALRLKEAAEPARCSNLLGVAFSGGGIRSATLNLGLLQGMAALGLLRRFDYLSTVSGGGYIGSWLAGWLRHTSLDHVEKFLAPSERPAENERPIRWEREYLDANAHEREPIQILREYSNYLTPQVGFFSADTWTMISVFIRNTLLNQLVLVLTLGAVLSVPYLVVPADLLLGTPHHLVPRVFALLAALALLVAVWNIGDNLQSFEPMHKMRKARDQDEVISQVVLPIFLAAYTAAIGLFSGNMLRKLTPGIYGWMTLFIFVCFAVLHYAGRLDRCFFECSPPARRGQGKLKAWLWLLGTSACSSLVGTGLIWLAVLIMDGWIPYHAPWAVVSFGVPLMVGAFSLMVLFEIGLLGRNFPDERREWWSRLGAWLCIFLIAWTALFGVSLYGPRLVEMGWKWISSLTFSWVISTIAGLWAGTSSRTGRNVGAAKPRENVFAGFVARVAPFVFIVGMFLGLAVGVHLLLLAVHRSLPNSVLAYFSWEHAPSASIGARHWDVLATLPGSIILLVCLLSGGIGWALARRVDVNEFSMHHFYKNRLVRCFMGASRWHVRQPNKFTGFDPEDDVGMPHLSPTCDEEGEKKPPAAYTGPYPVVNTALNLVHGKQLAWQERKAESFVFTPQFSGFELLLLEETNDLKLSNFAYRPTREFAGMQQGIHIGSAAAVSGAAASPNMGFATSPASAFLMTVFNVRLGWWFGNPRHEQAWMKAGPDNGLIYLLKDLFGRTDDSSQYVYLSDGGHFENLGIYELVRRRCKYIIVSDAGQDEAFTFENLGNAIRKCRVDFGVEIDIALDRLRRDPVKNHSAAHCVLGKITYPAGDLGTLVYLKSSLTGDEPADVLEYATMEPAFPHQSTADQWFDESQFESYRRLGQHIARSVFEPAAALHSPVNATHEFFEALEMIWYPPSSAIQKSFSSHSDIYNNLMEQVRKDPTLQFLDPHLYATLPEQPPASVVPQRRRDAVYICNQLLGLMSTVYMDLNLASEAQREHPHNQGWMRIFRYWKSTPAFQQTWDDFRNTYGEQFRSFYEHYL
ncbi:MAG TPA: hypothetical protein VMZ52_16820 [Bryobacteraceae bacterium]|nr:hypothetical protein [Bryobacteraceae bacterium]